MSYEPKVQVVRPAERYWRTLVEDEPPQPGDAYLVTGVPMPGERVSDTAVAGTVMDLDVRPVVRWDGQKRAQPCDPESIRPYDSDEALAETVARDWAARWGEGGIGVTAAIEGAVRTVLAAIREADNA